MITFEEWWCTVLAWDEKGRNNIKLTAQAAWAASKNSAQLPLGEIAREMTAAVQQSENLSKERLVELLGEWSGQLSPS